MTISMHIKSNDKQNRMINGVKTCISVDEIPGLPLGYNVILMRDTVFCDCRHWLSEAISIQIV